MRVGDKTVTAEKPASSTAKTVEKPKTTTVGETTITTMEPVPTTEAAKKHNLDGGKPPKHDMAAARRGIVRTAIRDFGFGGVTITGDDHDGDARDVQNKIDASNDDLERGMLLYGLGLLERKHENCVGASKHWMEARKLVLDATRIPLDTEPNRKRREQGFRFYGRIMIGEAFCDLQTGRALGVEEKLLKGLNNLFGVGDAERSEAWFAMGIARVESGDEAGGREMLLQAGRRGNSEKLRQAITAYAAAVGMKL